MINIHNPSEESYVEMHRLAGDIDGLVQHPAHVYKIMCDHFGDSIFLAEVKDQLAEPVTMGMMLGLSSHKMSGLLFVWQIGVASDMQGAGLGSRLLSVTIDHARNAGYQKVMATVETTNTGSQKLFEKHGFQVVSHNYAQPNHVLVNQHQKPAIQNYYGSGTDQIFYELKVQPG